MNKFEKMIVKLSLFIELRRKGIPVVYADTGILFNAMYYRNGIYAYAGVDNKGVVEAFYVLYHRAKMDVRQISGWIIRIVNKVKQSDCWDASQNFQGVVRILNVLADAKILDKSSCNKVCEIAIKKDSSPTEDTGSSQESKPIKHDADPFSDENLSIIDSKLRGVKQRDILILSCCKTLCDVAKVLEQMHKAGLLTLENFYAIAIKDRPLLWMFGFTLEALNEAKVKLSQNDFNIIKEYDDCCLGRMEIIINFYKKEENNKEAFDREIFDILIQDPLVLYLGFNIYRDLNKKGALNKANVVLELTSLAQKVAEWRQRQPSEAASEACAAAAPSVGLFSRAAAGSAAAAAEAGSADGAAAVVPAGCTP